MARHSKTAFTFGPELRARLRQLREKRGLTLRTMALLMDRQGAGAHVQLARLEKGQVKYPSVNLIADYLRACGERFEDLLDRLKSHSSQPPVFEQKGDAAAAELLKALPKVEQRAMNDVRTNDERKWVDKVGDRPIIMRPGGAMKYLSLFLAIGLLLVGVAPAADSLNVRFIGGYDTPTYAQDVAVKGGYAFIADADSGLRVVSIADPAHPVEVGSCPGSVRSVALYGDYAYVAWGDLRVISVADPAHPTPVDTCPEPFIINDLTIVGNYAYVADDDDRLWVYSLSDPAHPTVAGYCGLPDWAIAVDVAGDYAYVADQHSGLRVVSVADPSDPVEVGSCEVPGLAHGVATDGNYAYVTSHDSIFLVISTSDPAHPSEVGRWSMPNSSGGVAVAGDYVYVGNSESGLRVISVQDPAHPAQIGYYTLPYAYRVALDGGYVYAACGQDGLAILQFYGAGVEESPRPQVSIRKLEPTVISMSSVQSLKSKVVFNAMGRRVLSPRSGVFFVREASSVMRDASSVTKVVITR